MMNKFDSVMQTALSKLDAITFMSTETYQQHQINQTINKEFVIEQNNKCVGKCASRQQAKELIDTICSGC
jgi:hypothetical protein